VIPSASITAWRKTALHKLFFDPPGRYSEDIDLVQRTAGPIGPLVAEIRSVLDPWLGKPKWKAGQGRFTLTYRFDTTFTPVVRMRVKIEVNTREHFVVHGFISRPIVVDNPWFSGEVDVVTYRCPSSSAPSFARSTSARRGATYSTSRSPWNTRTSIRPSWSRHSSST
jgi:hypothetical protein